MQESVKRLLRDEKRIFGVNVRGIDPKSVSEVSKIKEYLISGDILQLDKDGAIVGKELARFLGLYLDRDISLQASRKKVHKSYSQGIFNSGMYEYDSQLLLIHIDKAKEMFKLNRITGIAVKLDNLNHAPLVKKKIKKRERINSR